MLMNEVVRITGLTKKAVSYYVEQGLLLPAVSENGYRNFSEADTALLLKISVLRKLGVDVKDIKAALSDDTGMTLQTISVQRELRAEREKAKTDLLYALSHGAAYPEITAQLRSIEQGETIVEKLLQAFPGSYGQFLYLHFSYFLNEPITTVEQQLTYQQIVSFLDGLPPLELPEDLQKYLYDGTKHLDRHNIPDLFAQIRNAYQDPDKFLSENENFLTDYLAFKQSDTYRNSPAYKLQSVIKKIYNTTGYCSVFIPALKVLSKSYAEYYALMESANEKLLAKYPEMQTLL